MPPAKIFLQKEALKLRKQGFSYSEIKSRIPVAKSSLSLWLHGVPLNNQSILRFKNKLKLAQKMGAKAKRKQRIEKTLKIEEAAISEIGNINYHSLLLMGSMLYWAEGSKGKENNISQPVAFANSDPLMCRLFLKWVETCLGVSKDEIVPTIYIHITHRKRRQEVLKFWSKEIGISPDNFGKVSLTNTRLSKKNRRDSSPTYFGQLRLRIRRSTDLNRKISGWIKGICIRSKVV